MGEIDYVERDLRRWGSVWIQTLKELQKLSETSEQSKNRHADIGACLRQLQRKENFGLVKNLAEYAQHKNKSNSLPQLVEALESELFAAIKFYLPAQSNGVEIARASFNYYTVNKKPKAYYDDKLKELRPKYQKLYDDYDAMKQNKAHQKSMLLEAFMQGFKPDKLEHFCDEQGQKVDFDLFTGKQFPKSVQVSEKFVEDFVQKFEVLSFRLTSYDLEKRYTDDIQTASSDMRRHTREIWQQFIDALENKTSGNQMAIRLNPELKIRYREADCKLKEYLEKKNFDLAKTKHRSLQDQYTVGLSFELNAGRIHEELAFATPKDLKRKIDEFNLAFNQAHWHKLWKYGIDRGQIELATLCIARFDEGDTYEYDGKKFLQPKFPGKGEQDIQVYELRQGKYSQKAKSNLEFPNNPERRKERRIVANLSYFIDRVEDEDWFEKKTATCIDLTTAKVIKGKIVNNGDILTFLKLKKEAAKRILFDFVAQGQITSQNATLKWGSDNATNSNYVKLLCEAEYKEKGKLKLEKRPIYFFEGSTGRNFNGLLLDETYTYKRESMLETLQKYLNGLLAQKNKQHNDASKHVPEKDKINHLRNALVANMVGVIFHLQKTYPGIILLEDLNIDLIQKHFQDLNLDISRCLERALYQKFQSVHKGWVPPHIKNIIAMREQERKIAKDKMEAEVKERLNIMLQKGEIKKNDKDKEGNKLREELKKERPYSCQIGAMVYVDEANTSKDCPYCGYTMKWKGKDSKIKFDQHRFVCGENKCCEFDTARIKKQTPLEPPVVATEKDFDFLHEIDDPDKVASYNVAKKVTDYQKILPFS